LAPMHAISVRSRCPEYTPIIQRFVARVQDSSGPVTHANDVA
jgi:hypothetical protein